MILWANAACVKQRLSGIECQLQSQVRSFFVSAVLLLTLIHVVHGDNFRHATIRWTKCELFADPLFPQVCSVKANRKIGFTISAAWDLTNTDQSMLSGAQASISNFLNGKCGIDGCTLFLSRQCSAASCQYTNERRIGFRRGFVESSPPYQDRSIPFSILGANAGLADNTQQAGIINCPVPTSCPGDVTTYPSYAFQIERVARGMVYARFAFEYAFPADDRWIVFFEGCCRLPSCSGGQCESNGLAVGVNNNAGLPFHIRAGVIVGSDTSLPTSSFRFEMPDLVMLRWNGVPDATQCTIPSFPTNTISFQVQGFHPDLKFASNVRFRLGTVFEQGLYKCVEHSPLFNINGPLVRVDVALSTLLQRCPIGGAYPVLFTAQGQPTNLQTGTYLSGGSFNYFQSVGSVRTPAVTVDATTGIVTFPVGNAGVWQLSIVADVCLCPEGCTGCTRTLSTPLDFIVDVRDAQNNPHPPQPEYSQVVSGLVGVSKVSPQTISEIPAQYANQNPYLSVDPAAYIKIQCGESTFYRDPSPSSGASLSQDFLRIAYRDSDDPAINLKVGCNNNIVSVIDVIQPSNALPTGLRIQGATLTSMQGAVNVGNGVNQTTAVDSRGYIDITWSPKCEDRSQVGVFMMCFEAQDKGAATSQNVLLSTPSIVNVKDSLSVVTPSCLFVQSLGPKPNPSPEVTVCKDGLCTTDMNTCSESCCDCCGAPSCECALRQIPCCSKIYSTLNYLNVYDLRSANLNNNWGLNFSLSFPCTDDSITSNNCLSKSIRDAWQQQLIMVPYLAPPKYGCKGSSYQSCISNKDLQNDVTTQLVWDLNRAKCCKGGNLDCSVCLPQRTCSANPSAVTINQCNDNEVCKSECSTADLGSPSFPFKVCVQALQIVPSDLNVQLWLDSYGSPPTNNSCLVCFMLTPQTKPAFVDGYSSNAPGPSNVGFWEVAVGKSLSLFLVAVDSSGDAVEIVMLPSPGAPNGASLTPTVPYPIYGRGSQTRTFSFTPIPAQVGMQYTVSFQPRASNVRTSVGDRRDYVIKVATTTLRWILVSDKDGSCPWPTVNGVCQPAGTQTVTVGCAYTYRLRASLDCSSAQGLSGCSYSSSYNLSLRMQMLPECSDCFDSPVDVKACTKFGLGSDDTCCGNNICDGAESASSCPQDCEPDGNGIVTCSTSSACSLSSNKECCALPTISYDPSQAAKSYQTQEINAVVIWTPSRNEQGRKVLRCVEAFDQTTDPMYATGTSAIVQSRIGIRAPSFCVLFDVLSCQYCVPAKATLKSIAKHYLLNVDWLRLYNSNPDISNPDQIISEQRIYLGPKYVVKEGDTLVMIAGEMRTTVKSIMQNNPSLSSDGKIAPGQSLCLLLCSNN